MPRLSSQACPRNPPSSPLVMPTWRWAGWSCWVRSTWAAKAWARQVDFGTYRLILVTAHVSWSTEKPPPPLRRPAGARASWATTCRTTRYGSSRKPTLIPPSRSAAWINSRRSAAGRRRKLCRALTPLYATPSLLGAPSPALAKDGRRHILSVTESKFRLCPHPLSDPQDPTYYYRLGRNMVRVRRSCGVLPPGRRLALGRSDDPTLSNRALRRPNSITAAAAPIADVQAPAANRYRTYV